jgi:hypothetical protein
LSRQPGLSPATCRVGVQRDLHPPEGRPGEQGLDLSPTSSGCSPTTARVVAALLAGGRRVRALTWACRYEAIDGTDPAGVWCRFTVQLAGPETALPLLVLAARPPSGEWRGR